MPETSDLVLTLKPNTRIDIRSVKKARNTKEFWMRATYFWGDIQSEGGIVHLCKMMIEEYGMDPDEPVEIYSITGTLAFVPQPIKYWAYGFPKKKDRKNDKDQVKQTF